MMKKPTHRNKFSFHIPALILFLLVIVIGFGGCKIYIHSFNVDEKNTGSGDSDASCKFVIEPRGGESDQWSKELKDDSMIYGVVYRASLDNYSEYEVSDWSVRINIQEDCYINSSWNGEVEIHQFTSEGEKVQQFDLRQYSSTTISLDHLKDDPDLLIPLKKGDYVIYHPSEKAAEYPIGASTDGDAEQASGLPGFIFYSSDEEALEFTDVTVSYHLNMHLQQLPAYWVFLCFFWVWVVLLIVYLAVSITKRSAERRIAQDAVIIEQSINVLINFIDAKDKYTNGHSRRVATYSRLLGEKLGMSEEECRHLYYTALMHDCGKISIPDAVLKKSGKLTDEEYQLIKTHPSNGADLLKDFTAIPDIQAGALYHHERYDGKGYPTGKKGEEIPLVGRIICVADSFDAMNSQRCYRDKCPRDYILSELRNNKGKQFDPQIADAFLRLIQEGRIELEG